MKKDSHTEEIKRYVGSLHEEHLNQFKIVQEGIKSINQRLDRMDNRSNRVESDVRDIKNNLTQKVDRHEFVSLEKRVGVVESK